MLAPNYCWWSVLFHYFGMKLIYFIYVEGPEDMVDYDPTGSLRYAGKAQHYKLVFGVALNQCQGSTLR